MVVVSFRVFFRGYEDEVQSVRGELSACCVVLAADARRASTFSLAAATRFSPFRGEVYDLRSGFCLHCLLGFYKFPFSDAIFKIYALPWFF